MTESRNAEMDLSQVGARLSANRALILAILLIGTVGTVLYTLLVPPVYEARATIILPASAPLNPAVGLAQQFGLSLPAGSGGSVEMFAAILESDRTLNYLKDRTGLSREKLRDMRGVHELTRTNMVEITANDRNQALALQLVQGSIEALRRFNAELSLPYRSKQRVLIDAELGAKQKAIEAKEAQIQAFLAKTSSLPVTVSGSGSAEGQLAEPMGYRQKVLDLQNQIQAVTTMEDETKRSISNAARSGDLPSDIPQLHDLYADLSRQQAALAAARATFTDQNPQVVSIKLKIAASEEAIKAQLAKYREAYGRGQVGNASDLAVKKKIAEFQLKKADLLAKLAPYESVEFSRLTREYVTLSKLVDQLTVQSEQAGVDAAADPNRWEILDAPEIEDKPVNKHLGMNTAFGFVASLFLAAIVGLVRKA